MGSVMRAFEIFQNQRGLLRVSVVVLLGGVAAGCSSGATRFADAVDGISTASTGPANSSPYSTNNNGYSAPAYNQNMAAAPVAAAPNSTVSRSALAPASGSAPALAPAYGSTPPVQQAQTQTPPSAPAQQQVASLPQQTPTLSAPQNGSAPAVQQQTANPAAPASGGTGGYVVSAGDTLSSVARKHGVSVEDLKRANNLDNGLIRIGQSLTIPKSGDTQVASTAPVAPKPEQPAPAVQQQAAVAPKQAEQAAPATGSYTPPSQQGQSTSVDDASKQVASAPQTTGISKMRWPVNGRVVTTFGKGTGKSSDGLDIAVPVGTPVKAAENGVVIYAGDGLKEFGNTVLVRHDNGLVTVYGHNSEIKVNRGDKVSRGQDLALSGASGSAGSPKLHFEVRKNSSPVDPSTYLE
ncbi:peptidoglycan DD-metalloendopeptidase family protein [Limoniibacter endophyticus]|uniref:LysM domain-containing protein n=1 Tax=Limoniibacter endophyticus TaxID=1565040 RepID=A0A8J3GG37_9HYPH|nr:peptidoglycan DD-metalloendopeptidase family protein [Limoniibacter endophyticus]GHC62786.1 hypothetical protein GCM10010136_04070 [Limoniibacter endophyticus]